MQSDLNALKQRWLATGQPLDEQAYLSALACSDEIHTVFLDPDGTLPPWLGVVVRAETGVLYANQCAGLSTEQRLVQGYFVPLGGSKYDVDGGEIEVAPFIDVFHNDGACQWNWQGAAFPKDRLDALAVLVKEIAYWSTLEDRDRRDHLYIDQSRIEELAEAWIPVLTPDGPAVLVYTNCD
jgi:Family of unknown function (DUF6210)